VRSSRARARCRLRAFRRPTASSGDATCLHRCWRFWPRGRDLAGARCAAAAPAGATRDLAPAHWTDGSLAPPVQSTADETGASSSHTRPPWRELGDERPTSDSVASARRGAEFLPARSRGRDSVRDGRSMGETRRTTCFTPRLSTEGARRGGDARRQSRTSPTRTKHRRRSSARRSSGELLERLPRSLSPFARRSGPHVSLLGLPGPIRQLDPGGERMRATPVAAAPAELGDVEHACALRRDTYAGGNDWVSGTVLGCVPSGRRHERARSGRSVRVVVQTPSPPA